MQKTVLWLQTPEYPDSKRHALTYMAEGDDDQDGYSNLLEYALKGNPTNSSDKGFITKTTPLGAGQALNPLALALASNVSFLARGFAGDIEHLSRLLQTGIEHHGFALIDILQPCVGGVGEGE